MKIATRVWVKGDTNAHLVFNPEAISPASLCGRILTHPTLADKHKAHSLKPTCRVCSERRQIFERRGGTLTADVAPVDLLGTNGNTLVAALIREIIRLDPGASE